VSRRKTIWVITDVFIVLFCLVFMYPILIGVMNSFKSRTDIVLRPLAITAEKMSLDTYLFTCVELKYVEKFMNSFVITVCSVALVVLFSSMAAYKLTRENTKLSAWLFRGIIAFMLVPFQCTMLPLVVMMTRTGLIDTYAGMIIGYLGFQCPFALFLYHAYLRTIPLVLDESAKIDGCSSIRTFFTIIFPLALPMTATIIILNVLATWNDFLFPMVMLTSMEKRTLVTGLVAYAAARMKQWDRLLTGTFLIALPIITVYIFMQRHIINGMVTGALKE